MLTCFVFILQGAPRQNAVLTNKRAGCSSSSIVHFYYTAPLSVLRRTVPHQSCVLQHNRQSSSLHYSSNFRCQAAYQQHRNPLLCPEDHSSKGRCSCCCASRSQHSWRTSLPPGQVLHLWTARAGRQQSVAVLVCCPRWSWMCCWTLAAGKGLVWGRSQALLGLLQAMEPELALGSQELARW